ncbi:TetR/AcrR family transcriptional regulator [Mycolicibacterium thermoresistibile]
MSTQPLRGSASDGTLSGRRRMPSKGERQRQAILDSLARLLADRPIGELTVGEIAAAAGVRRSGYYFYFESKYTALAVLTSQIWSELMERAQAFRRLDHESVADFQRRTIEAAVSTWHAHDAVLVASIQAIPLDEQLATMWRTWNERLVDILTEELLKGRQQGVAHPVWPDVSVLVATLLEMTMHIFYLDRLNKCTPEQTETMISTVSAIWLASGWGVRPDQG